MIVDVCDIVVETSKNVTLEEFGLDCKSKSYKNLISYYIENIDCCPCEDTSVKCATVEPKCDNTILRPASCSLCIYPNNFLEEPCQVSIMPDNTIPNVKMISPNT